MGERITGGTLFKQQPTIGETVLEGAKKLVALGEGIGVLEGSDAQVVTVTIGNVEDRMLYNPVHIPVSRAKLLELLKAEQDYVGAQLARILGTLYGPK
jgi:hypothetical protein